MEKITKTTKKDKKYFEAVGRRKTSVARVRIEPSSKSSFMVNDQDVKAYFKTKALIGATQSAFAESKVGDKFSTTVLVNGGGTSSQAMAVRHGLARALSIFDEDARTPLKKAGFLSRDARAKERRKFGLKKARKAPQWSKR